MLRAAAILAAAAALARDADAALLIPAWLAGLLQLPALAMWMAPLSRRRAAGAPSGAERPPSDDTPAARPAGAIWALALLVAAVGVALLRRSADAYFVCTTTCICGQLLIDAASRLLDRLDAAAGDPLSGLKILWPAWAISAIAVSILLALPLATRSGVPDYRHNFWNHVLAATTDAIATACLIGPMVYNFAENYAPFGRAVIWLLTETSGLAFAALGLAIFTRLVGATIRLARFLHVLIALQAAGVVVLWLAGPLHAETQVVPGLWHSLALASSALWNTSLLSAAGGLARELDNPWFFCTITVLATLGSIGLPVVWMLVRPGAPGGPTRGSDPRPRPAPTALQSLPQAEAGTAFLILALSAGMIFLCETPQFLPERLVPSRPLDLGSSQAPLRDEPQHGQRWRLAVFTAVTLRSAGLQSFPVSEGALSWPGVGLFLLLMALGGSAAGVAGGMRTTSLIAPLLLLLRSSQAREDAPSNRRSGLPSSHLRLAGRALLWIPLWGLFVSVVGLMLGLTAEATRYEIAFDAVTAAGNVNLSTGLIPHLPWPARLSLIASMILGRWLPIAFWCRWAVRASRLERAEPPPAPSAMQSA